MADTGTMVNLPTLGQVSKKTRDMAYATSPMNNNELNLTSMEKKAGVVGKADKKDAQGQTGNVGQAAQQAATQQGQQLPQVQGLQSNLGSFSLSLQAEMNKFLQGGTAQANVNMAGGGTSVYNPETGMYQAPEMEGQFDASLSGVIDEKTQQQQGLMDKSKLIFDESGKARTLEEVLKDFADEDGSGDLSEQETANLNRQFGIVNELRRLKQLDPNSPEAEALKMQLLAEDKDGIVSGLEQAMERYEEISGVKAVGADDTEYALRDLLNMGNDELVSELEKAVSTGTGLFAGDYTADVKRKMDESKAQYRTASQQDVGILNTSADEAENWLTEYDDEMSGYRDSLNSKFLQSAQDVVQQLEATKAEEIAAGRDGKWVDQAKSWFVDLQQQVKSGSTDFATVVQALLKQNGLNPQIKATLENWLGSEVGGDTLAKGKLASILDEVSKTGHVIDDEGNPVAISSAQKAEIANIIANDGMNAEQKSEAVQKKVSEWTGKLGRSLESDAKNIAAFVKDGNADAALNTFEAAMVGSLEGFKDSVTKDFYNLMTKQGVNLQQLGPQGVQDAISNLVKIKREGVAKSVESAKKTVADVAEKAAQDKEKLTKLNAQVATMRNTGVTNTKNNVENVLRESAARYSPMIANLLGQYGIDPTTAERRAGVYSFVQLLRRSPNIAKFFPGAEAYLSNPRYVLGNSAQDMEKIAYVEKMMSQIPYDKLFDETEAAKAITSKTAKIEEATKKADEGAVTAHKLNNEIDSVFGKIQGELDAVSKTTADELFNNALVGRGVGFTGSSDAEQYSNKIINLKNRAGYTQSGMGVTDAETGLMTAGAGGDASGGETEIASWTPVKVEPTVVQEAVKNIVKESIRGEKREREPAEYESTHTLMQVETKDHGTQYVAVPNEYSSNPMGYLSQQSDQYLQARPASDVVKDAFGSVVNKLSETGQDIIEFLSHPLDNTVGKALEWIGNKLATGASNTPEAKAAAEAKQAATDAAYATSEDANTTAMETMLAEAKAEREAEIQAEWARQEEERVAQEELDRQAAEDAKVAEAAQRKAEEDERTFQAEAKKKAEDADRARKAAAEQAKYDARWKKPQKEGGDGPREKPERNKSDSDTKGSFDKTGSYFSGKGGDER